MRYAILQFPAPKLCELLHCDKESYSKDAGLAASLPTRLLQHLLVLMLPHLLATLLDY